jgi:hypothetical protein
MTLLAILIGGTFLAVTHAIQTIDVATVPAFFQGFVIFVQNFFSAGVLAVGLIWLRNTWGYLEAYMRERIKGEVQLEYDVNKWYKTAAYYIGSIAVVFNLAPTPTLRAIGVAVVFFMDLLGSIIGRIWPKE